MPGPNVRQNIKKFRDDKRRIPTGRYSSFDYCYNYFYSFHKNPRELGSKQNIEKSCLHIGFFLASWGMYRGSTTVLQKNAKYYKKLVEEVIAKKESTLYWDIDADNYNEKNIKLLLDLKEKIEITLGNNPSNTLVTKIMLGIFGNTPAFDRNFRKGMGRYKLPVYKFNKTALEKISKFYVYHKKALNYRIRTFNFLDGQKTNIVYTKAKLIDMAAFQAGMYKK
jgi:hypothetical protein